MANFLTSINNDQESQMVAGYEQILRDARKHSRLRSINTSYELHEAFRLIPASIKIKSVGSQLVLIGKKSSFFALCEN